MRRGFIWSANMISQVSCVAAGRAGSSDLVKYVHGLACVADAISHFSYLSSFLWTPVSQDSIKIGTSRAEAEGTENVPMGWKCLSILFPRSSVLPLVNHVWPMWMCQLKMVTFFYFDQPSLAVDDDDKVALAGWEMKHHIHFEVLHHEQCICQHPGELILWYNLIIFLWRISEEKVTFSSSLAWLLKWCEISEVVSVGRTNIPSGKVTTAVKTAWTHRASLGTLSSLRDNI